MSAPVPQLRHCATLDSAAALRAANKAAINTLPGRTPMGTVRDDAVLDDPVSQLRHGAMLDSAAALRAANKAAINTLPGRTPMGMVRDDAVLDDPVVTKSRGLAWCRYGRPRRVNRGQPQERPTR